MNFPTTDFSTQKPKEFFNPRLHEIFNPDISTMNLIFSLFQTLILKATASKKLQFKLEKKSSSSNLIFQTGELQKIKCRYIGGKTGSRHGGGGYQKLLKFADVLNGWSLDGSTVTLMIVACRFDMSPHYFTGKSGAWVSSAASINTMLVGVSSLS